MRYRALVVGVVLLAATSLPAASQIKLDMNKITCGEWLGLYCGPVLRHSAEPIQAANFRSAVAF